MIKTPLKKIACMVMIASVCIATDSGMASSLDSALNGMFSNLTSGGVVKTPDRTAFVGGGLEIRTPVANINLVTFDPPRISAGCGGLDMFGGSFSFINSAQLVALLRKIAANAVSLAFKAAIYAINPQLGTLMSEFSKLVNDINQGAMNSCLLARKLDDTIWNSDTLASIRQPIDAALASAKGINSDWTQGLTQFTSQGPAASDQQVAQFDMSAGNGVWDMINAKGLGRMLTDPTNPSSADGSKNSNEIIMSITGLAVSQIKSMGTDPSGALLNNSGNGNYVYTLDISDLLNGSSASHPLRKFVCDTDYDPTMPHQTCLNITFENFQFPGMKGYVNSILNGVDNDGNPTGQTLVDAIAAGTLTQQQQILLQSTQVPVLAFLNNIGSSPAAQQQVIKYLTNVIANGMLISYVSAVSRVTSELQNNPTSPLRNNVADRIKDLRAQAEKLKIEQDKEIDQINKVQLFVETARKGNIAAFYTANRAGTH